MLKWNDSVRTSMPIQAVGERTKSYWPKYTRAGSRPPVQDRRPPDRLRSKRAPARRYRIADHPIVSDTAGFRPPLRFLSWTRQNFLGAAESGADGAVDGAGVAVGFGGFSGEEERVFNRSGQSQRRLVSVYLFVGVCA